MSRQFFDAAYVNLDCRPDRLAHVKTQLEKIGMHAWRQPGMLPHQYKGDRSLVEVMRKRTPGAIGCHYSQRKIIEVASTDERDILVMEDDVVFCEDFWDRVAIIKQFIDSRPWDIFWFGATFHCNPPVWHRDDLGRDVELTDHPNILKTYGIWSTYAWLVNGKSTKKVLKLLDDNVRESIGIDALMIKVQPTIESYCFVPGLVKQRDDRSNIGINRDGSPAVTKFSGFANLGPYWWQERMSDFDPNTFNWAEAAVSG